MSKKFTHTGKVIGDGPKALLYPDFNTKLRQGKKFWITERGLKFRLASGFSTDAWGHYHLDLATITLIETPQTNGLFTETKEVPVTQLISPKAAELTTLDIPTKKTFLFFDIQWDTDGKKVASLPQTYTVDITDAEFDPENEGADLLSDKFGYCVNSFCYNLITA